MSITRFSDSFVSYAREFTDTPPIFLQWAAYLTISASLSRSCYVPLGSWNVSPHLWLIFIGKSSSHKSTALGISEQLIESVFPDRMPSHEFSQEQILHTLQTQPRRFFTFDEARHFFSMLDKKYNDGMKSLFTILYRKPNYSRSTIKHGTLNIIDAYPVIGTASTPEWLRESIADAESSALSGFLSRFLMVPYLESNENSMPLPPPHDLEKFGALKDAIRVFGNIAHTFCYTPDAAELFKVHYRDVTELEDRSEAVLGPFFEHLKNEAVHKLSVLIAVDKGEAELTAATLKEAISSLGYIEKMLPQTILALTSSKWDREHKRLVELIRKSGIIDRSDLSRMSHLSGQHLTAHLTGLYQDRLIEITDSKSANGKLRSCIAWKGE